MLKLFAIIIIAGVSLWYLILPALVVLSLLPQTPTPPINWVTRPPNITSLTPTLDLYEGAKKVRGNLIIFHAANEKGKDDERLQRLATIFARAGIRVFVPTLANLNREKFHPNVIEEMKEVIQLAAKLSLAGAPLSGAAKQNPKEELMVLSFSIGVGPQLIAGADGEIRDQIDLLIAFGGYSDLKNVVAFHTIGQGQDPFGLWLFARYYAQFLPEADAEIFYEIADRKWQDPRSDISDLAKGLGIDGKKALALLENKDPQAAASLIDNLPMELKNFFAVFDPEPALAALEAPVLLLHSRLDPVIPFEESEKLLAALKAQNKKAQLIELKVFDHVNPVLPELTLKNLFTLYLPEFGRLYKAAWKIVY